MLVGLAIQLQAKKRKRLTCSLAHLRRVLANSGGEYECIDSPQYGDHRSDSCLQTMYINVEREFRTGMSLFHGGQDLAHVFRQARYSKQSRLLIKHIINLARLQPALTQ